MIVLKVVLQGW